MQGAPSTFNTNDSVPFQEKDKDEIMKQIDNYDATMLSYLGRLYEAMNSEKMDFTKIKTAVDALAQFNKKSEYNYLNNLLYPEKCKGVKIPSPIPVPSCSFQLHNSMTITTNNIGNFCLVFNPFFLASSEGLSNNEYNYTKFVQGNYHSINADGDLGNLKFNTKFYTSMYLNNDPQLNGASESDKFVPIDIGQNIEPIYDQYRLVSASVIIKYIGRLDQVSGVLGGAVVFDESPSLGCFWNGVRDEGSGSQTAINSYYKDPSLYKYGNFDLARDSFYHQENMSLEGIRMLYFPIDNSYEEYSKLLSNNYVDVTLTDVESHPGLDLVNQVRFTTDNDNLKNGFRYMIYSQGAPPNSACFKLDIYCNYECLPNAKYLNYLPLSLNTGTISNYEKKSAITLVQQKPIMKSNEVVSGNFNKPSIWEKLKKKFSNSLPGIGKLLSWGLTTMIPQLKPGLALAGTMISQNNADMEEEVE